MAVVVEDISIRINDAFNAVNEVISAAIVAPNNEPTRNVRTTAIGECFLRKMEWLKSTIGEIYASVNLYI